MKVRRLVVALAALMAGPAAWVASAEPAHAGGPTSVLLSNPAEGRVGALHQSQSDYQRLVELVGAYEPVKGETTRPDAVHNATNDAYRLTWMIHDMTVWRIDMVYETADGVWIETKVDPTGAGDIFAGEARWNQLPRNDKAVLSTVFRNAGILSDSPAKVTVPVDPTPEVAAGDVSTTAAAGPSSGVVAAGAGLAGLVIGAGATLLLRRARTTIRRPRAVLTG